jgi:antitoxin (DNA-binding transcriptional repressor) of toxin-antitoxin stability system
VERTISATRAARMFSDLLNRVRYRSETFIIERGGMPVGRLTPAGASRCTVAELATHLRDGPKPDPGYWKELAAITRRQPKLPKSPWRR